MQRRGLRGRGAPSPRVEAFFGKGKTSEPEPVVSEKRRLLLSYVQEVEPAIVDQFQEIAPAQVIDAMTQTVSNMVGTLPPQFFNVTISTHGENLAQLMFSVMMTGYLFRNAQYRLELTHSLALPAGASDATGTSFFPQDSSEFAPGTQKTSVKGDVIRWNNSKGPESIPAAQYIESLEEELRVLRQQVAQQRSLIKQVQNPEQRNALLDYLKSLDERTLEDLTACADDDSVESMNTFIHRVLGTNTHQELRQVNSESKAEELSHLLYYLMVVGYLLRTLEVRFYLDNSSTGDLWAGSSGSDSDSSSGLQWGF